MPAPRRLAAALTTAALAALLIARLDDSREGLAATIRGGDAAPVAAPSSGVMLSPARTAAVERLLAGMTLREKAAQMVMPWIPGGLVPGSAAYRRVERLVRTHRVGGVIVGKGDGARTARALRALQAGSAAPLLVAADLEWGAGMRLEGSTLLPTAMALAATGDTALAFAHGLATAAEGRAAGVHVAFAPVLDVNVDPRNPIINTRSFGEDPATVAVFGRAALRGLQAGGMLAVGKHFPGHGDTDQDSHLTLPTIGASRARLDSVELPPFRAAVAGGIDGVMVGHIAVPALTGGRTPASLSRAVVTTLLRDRLEFDGLVFTDALNMAGVRRSAGEASSVALQAVQAGADVLLQPTSPELAIEAIAEAVQRGELPPARLDASVRRILRAKAAVGLLDREAAGAPARERRAPQRPALPPARLADTIATRAMTLLRDSAALLPLDTSEPVLTLVHSGIAVPGGANAAFERALREAGLGVERRALSSRRAAALADSLLGAWARPGARPPRVVVASYSQAVPWRGGIGLPAATGAAVERLARRVPVTHVVFGDPYASRSVPSASTVLLAWSPIPAVQRAAARALLGREAIGGRLPVSLPPRYPLGYGVKLPAADAAP